MKTQYQIEKEDAIKNGVKLEDFENDWHNRACAVYRKQKTQKEIRDFRSGKIKI